ncbi:MAG: TolC family protein [Oscillospiraceae bacterium]|nr:TolC family protein [Oscillospiraceae bacterium]
MKRIISTVLTLCLIIAGATAFAGSAAAIIEDTPPRTQPMLRLNHADIEQQVRRNNPIIRNNAITQQGLTDFIGTPMMVDTVIAGQNALLAMQRNTSAVLTQIMATPSDGPDPVRDGIIMSLMNDVASIERDIMQMSMQIEQMHSDPVRNTVSRGIQQINNANRQIIWGVESMYLGYHTLSRQLEQTRENLTALNLNIGIMERRHAVGHVTARTLQNLRNTRTQLEAGIVSMENELENLRGQINIMLGRNANAPISLGAVPAADRDFLDSRDRERDLRSARGSNAAINLARIDRDENAALSGENARRQEAIATNTYDSEVRALSQRQESLIRAIGDRLVTLELAEEQLEVLNQTLEETQRRFSRGMIARIDLENAQSEVRLQQIRVNSADAELFNAIRRYEWFVNGLNT